MADPAPYKIDYSFSGFQANAPTTPLPATRLDAELANIAEAIQALVNSVKNVRRADGALQNEVVTYESLSPALQLTFDPTNGEAVADAVADAQAAAIATAADLVSVIAERIAAETAATEAAASASEVNLALYLPKAGNLAGLGSAATARQNLEVAKVDGSDITGRLATLTGATVTDFNAVLESGWSAGNNASNAPSTGYWLVQTTAVDAFYVTQIGYNYQAASISLQAVTPMRRHSYNNAGAIAWTAWESMSPVGVGSTVWFNCTSPPPGFLKENGALLNRANFPALYAFAAASGNIVTEASWTGGNTGAFSSGDLSTTFRIPDARGEFIRAYDDSRGVDSGRVLGAHQNDEFKAHAHTTISTVNDTLQPGGSNIAKVGGSTSSGSTGGVETRPRNNAKLACIKY